MATCEGLHKRFLSIPTSGLTVLGFIDDNFEQKPLELIYKFADVYNKKLEDNSVNNRLRECFRTFLCYEYKLKFEGRLESAIRYSNERLFQNVLTTLSNYEFNDEIDELIIYDTVILQVVLYFNLNQINSLLTESIKNKNLHNYYHTIEQLISAINLKAKLFNFKNKEDEESIKAIGLLLLLETESWFKIIDENNSQEWRSFISFLVKVMNTFTSPETFSRIWELIAKYEFQITDKKSLSLLCAIIEDFLSEASNEIVGINSNFCSDERILTLISNHLVSKIQFYRKQAQFILKKIMGYLKAPRDSSTERLNTKFTAPFVFCEDTNREEFQNKFFLLLESLEEKQTHLILPALSHLDSFIKINCSQKCGNCLAKNWLRCIFIRMLHHDNSIIMKRGLNILLEMDLRMFDDEFIELLVESLNNTFLYDNQSSEPCPQVVKKLQEVFVRAESTKSHLLRNFIVIASRIGWSPIPLFYIFEALGNNKKINQIKYNIWSQQELEAVMRITETSMRLQTKVMQITTQINIVKCITIYVKPPVDLLMLGKIFSSFPNNFSQRGMDTWKLLSDYLTNNIDEAIAIKFVSENCKKLCTNETRNLNIKVLAILTVLLYDARKIFSKKSCVSSISLCNLFNSLVGVDKRPYADLSVCFNALKMITCLLKLSAGPSDVYFQLILPFMESVMNLILKSLRTIPQSYGEAETYVEVFSAIVNIRDLLPDKTRIFNNFLDQIREKELMKVFEVNNKGNASSIHSWLALNILYLCNECSASILYEIPSTFVINHSDGKIVSECYGLIGKINHQLIKYSKTLPNNSSKQFLIKLTNLAETKADHAIPCIVASLEEMIKKSRNENASINSWSENVKNIIDICWKNAWDMKRGTEFRIAIQGLTKLIINKYFLEVEDFKKIALDYVDEILSKSENTPALRYILFSQMNSLGGKDLFIFEESIMSSIFHTNSGRTDKRVELQTCCYITKNYNINYMEESLVWGLGMYTDFIIRTQLILLILKMISWNSGKIGDTYVPRLMSFLEKQKNKRYFGDSSQHKMKHRAMQLLLLLQPHLDEVNVKNVHDTISDLILSESNQPSVRIMQEWILIRIYLINKKMRDSVWNSFASGRENRPGSITSLVSVIYHVSRLLPADEKLEYIEKALTHILPSCFSQQFIVRLYSQVVLSKLFEIIHEISANDADQYSTIEEAVRESLRHGNLMTNSIKLFDNFYFAVFDPIKDYDLQTIYYDLPRLSNVSMNERITPELFKQLNSDLHELPINIQNRGELSCAEIWEMSKEAYGTQEPDFVEENDALVDIQKKIIPATSGASDDSAAVPITLRQKIVADDTGLIVIASLIDSFPNLGGLARTAEIFCARELVLKSKRYTENREFQSLSVTAEKWITISEVKPHELRTYLLEKKSMGWNLVGAEQTANSINLIDMKFEGKTVLLLGNEKNGIPANLIQLMDVCVEIPQAGVVRSLNVHVTGAICMWQYATQHIFNC